MGCGKNFWAPKSTIHSSVLFEYGKFAEHLLFFITLFKPYCPQTKTRVIHLDCSIPPK